MSKPSSTLAAITGIARNPSEEPPPGTDLQRMAEQVERKNAAIPTPAHYDKTVQPWDLIECMESTGNLLVDHLRATAIEYLFRIKDDPRRDLEKAVANLNKAISLLP